MKKAITLLACIISFQVAAQKIGFGSAFFMDQFDTDPQFMINGEFYLSPKATFSPGLIVFHGKKVDGVFLSSNFNFFLIGERSISPYIILGIDYPFPFFIPLPSGGLGINYGRRNKLQLFTEGKFMTYGSVFILNIGLKFPLKKKKKKKSSTSLPPYID